MPHFKAFGMINLQYEVSICQILCIIKAQILVGILLSVTDVNCAGYETKSLFSHYS
jgi:hypothetical protein